MARSTILPPAPEGVALDWYSALPSCGQVEREAMEVSDAWLAAVPTWVAAVPTWVDEIGPDERWS